MFPCLYCRYGGGEMHIECQPIDGGERIFEGCDRTGGAKKWTESRFDLAVGSDLEFRALSEVYTSPCNTDLLRTEFIGVWVKMVNADALKLT